MFLAAPIISIFFLEVKMTANLLYFIFFIVLPFLFILSYKVSGGMVPSKKADLYPNKLLTVRFLKII
jgi:hypothetical protein